MLIKLVSGVFEYVVRYILAVLVDDQRIARSTEVNKREAYGFRVFMTVSILSTVSAGIMSVLLSKMTLANSIWSVNLASSARSRLQRGAMVGRTGR